MKNQTTKTLQSFSLKRWTFPLCLAILLSMLYLHYFENRAFVELDINVSQRTWLSFFWAKDGQEYSKWREVRVRVTPAEQKYRFYLTDLRQIRKLRIDTHDYRGEAVLNKLLISQKGFEPLAFRTKKDFDLLNPLNQIEFTDTDGDVLKIQSTGNDPQLELLLNLHANNDRSPIVMVPVAAIFVGVFLFFFLTDEYRNEKEFIPLFFVVAFSLILTMAAITRENVHPDEYVHLDAGNYYITNWLPPAIDDPAIQHTYSIYGISRLNSPEVSYLFTGKLAALLSQCKVTELLSLRMFNIILFGLIFLYLLKNSNARFMAAPLLISPQLWYLFSYCNSDAFALALSFFIACQVALPNSLLNSYLLGEREKRKIFLLIPLSILFALLFLLKKNYWFFYIFIAGYLVWRALYLIEEGKKKQYLQRFAVVIVAGLALSGLRIGTDYMVNGMDKADKLIEVQEKLASPIYKPSTPLEKQHPFLHRKARGESLKKIIVVDRWFEKTYRSAFGMYGYFTAIAANTYYDTVRSVGIAFFALLTVAIMFRGGISGNLLFCLFLSCSGALIFASLYHSWTQDFQTQGRYLFPVIPMVSIVLYHSRHLMMGAVFKLLLTSMFLLSVYSFIFVGLSQLPKI